MGTNLNFLVIGLGSMGKRRIRNLQALGIKTISGLDPRTDRREETARKYNIPVFSNINTAMQDKKPQVFIVSTPPSEHMYYANYALSLGIDCFIEASVVGSHEISTLGELALKRNVIMAPSCTMRFYPGPQKIRELLREGTIGSVLNVNYQTGQYLPDWHPWESIEEYYVSKRETGGAREIVPFELTWLNEIFGAPTALRCFKTKLSSLSVDIDDIYHCLIGYEGGVLLNLTVEVISRPKMTRQMRIIGSEGQIVFNGESHSVRYISLASKDWTCIELETGTVESRYINPEEPYITEIKCFLDALAARDPSIFPNSLRKDHLVLETLAQLEKLAEGDK